MFKLFSFINKMNILNIFKLIGKIILCLFCFIWFFWLLIKAIELIRAFIHWISDKNNFWLLVLCLVIVCIGGFLFCEFYLHLGLWDKFIYWVLSIWGRIKEFFNFGFILLG